MTTKELLTRLANYSGENIYLNTLKETVGQEEELSFTQILLAKKFLMSHAIKTDDKTITIETIKEFKIDWDRYSIRPPYPFQRFGINWLLNKERAILGDDPGLGKSIQSIVAALELKADKVLIVCPASLKLNWAKEIIPFCNEVSVVNKEWSPKRFTIINYDILKKYSEKIIKHKFDLIISDECFPYETLVTTNKGIFPIGEIVERALDVETLSFNHLTNQTEWKPIARYIKKETDTLLRIKLPLGLFIDCTPNHKIYVNGKGYIRADEVKEGDELFTLPNATFKETQDILLETMFYTKQGYDSKVLPTVSNCINGRSKLWKKTILLNNLFEQWAKKNNSKSFNSFAMSNVRQSIFKKTESEKTFLFNKLFSKMENATTRNTRKDFYRRTNKKDGEGAEVKLFKQPAKSKRLFQKNEGEQSNEQSSECREDEAKINRENFFIKRREWEANNATNKGSRSFRDWLDNRISYCYSKCKGIIAISSSGLQSRYRKPFIENRNRSGRKISQVEKVEISGQEKNPSVRSIRVESVEVLELGYRQGSEFNNSTNTAVYNLEIVENHNYFANNILVSNCHYLKNSSIRTKAFGKIATKIKRVWLLSGTPMANKPIDFYNLLKICKHELGKNKQLFGQTYCGGEMTQWGYDYNGASNLKELHYKTQNVILRRRKEDVLDLPPKIQIPVFLDLKNRKGYDNAVNEYYIKKNEDLAGELEWMQYEIFGKLNDKSFTEKLVELSILRKFTALEKIKDGSTFELIDNTLEQDKKIIVFTNYLDVIDAVSEHYKENCLSLDGRLSLEERQRRVDLFQSNKGPSVIVCNLAIASVGLTLTAASVAIMNDLSWSPSVMMQAEDRLYRIGQKESVNILYPVYDDSMDSIIFEVLKEKIKNINHAIEGKEIERFKGDITTEIFNRLKLKKKENVIQ